MLLKPFDDILSLGSLSAGGVEWRPFGVVGDPVEVRPASEQVLGGAALPCGACVPERLGHLLGVRVVTEELSERVEQSQGSRDPRLVDIGAAGHEEPGHFPAAVADGVRERGADRVVGCVDVRPSVDQGSSDVPVVAAGRPMQRGLVPGLAGVGVCAGFDQQPYDLGAVREVPGPVGDSVQRCPGLVAAPERCRPDAGMVGEELAQGCDVAGVDGSDDRVGDLGRPAHCYRLNPTSVSRLSTRMLARLPGARRRSAVGDGFP